MGDEITSGLISSSFSEEACTCSYKELVKFVPPEAINGHHWICPVYRNYRKKFTMVTFIGKYEELVGKYKLGQKKLC